MYPLFPPMMPMYHKVDIPAKMTSAEYLRNSTEDNIPRTAPMIPKHMEIAAATPSGRR